MARTLRLACCPRNVCAKMPNSAKSYANIMGMSVSVSRIPMPLSPIWISADDSCHVPWPALCWSKTMQDLLWISILLGLVAASLGYVRLCDGA